MGIITTTQQRPQHVSNDSIQMLPIKDSLKCKLESNGYKSIRQIKSIIENNKQEIIQNIPGIGKVKFESIQNAVLNFDTESTSIVIPEEQKHMSKEKKEINKWDMKNILIEFLSNKFNDPNWPKYPASQSGQYPSDNMLFTDSTIFIKLEWIEQEFSKYVKENYILLQTGNIFDSQSGLIKYAISNFKHQDSESPILFNIVGDQYYAFSGYPSIVGNRDKYIRIDREKFELYTNKTLDLTMSDELTEEWARYDPAAIKAEQENNKWDQTRALAEVWSNQKKPDGSVRLIMEYCFSFVKEHGSYEDINDEVIPTIKKYIVSMKDKPLMQKATILLEDIERDKSIIGMASAMHGTTSIQKKPIESSTSSTPVVKVVETKKEEPKEKTVEQVLKKDLKNLPEDIRKEIVDEIIPPLTLPPMKSKNFDLCIISSKRFGDTCIVMFSIITKKKTDDKYNFDTDSVVGTYQFNKDDIENGTLTIQSDYVDEIKQFVISEIRAF